MRATHGGVWTLCIGIGSGFALCNPAQAQIANQAPPASYAYVSGQSTYLVAPGGSVSVPLYLQESIVFGGSSLLGAEEGLGEAGVQANISNMPLDPAFITNVIANSAFNYNSSPALTFPTSGASISEFTIDGGVEASLFPGPGLSDVLLGTLTIQAGSTPGVETDYAITPLTPNNDGGLIGNTFTYLDNYDLDYNTDPYFGGGSLYNDATSSTFSVITTGAVAPLPAGGAMVLLGMPLVYLVSRRRGHGTRA